MELTAAEVRALVRTPDDIAEEAARLRGYGFCLVVFCTTSEEATALRRYLDSTAGFTGDDSYAVIADDGVHSLEWVHDVPITTSHASFPEDDAAAVAAFGRRSLLGAGTNAVSRAAERTIDEITDYLGGGR